MKTLPDTQLLREYIERRSDAAFEELVRRHIDLVHAVAQRTVQDSHLAKDVTQGVFLALARSAGSLAKQQSLAAWLHSTARHIAAQAVRGERRRQAREQAAAAMNTSAESGPGWEVVSPQLDAVIGELAPSDREAILLRYFERKPAHEMAAVLGISSEAAQKRVNRAVERMRLLFAKRGVAAGAAGLAGVIAAHAAPPAPLGLAAVVTERSLAVMAGSATATSATTTLAMTIAQKSALAAAIIILAGSCLSLALRDPSPASASAGSAVPATAITARSRPSAGVTAKGNSNSTGQSQNPLLASFKRRWLEIGEDNGRIDEQDALAKETVAALSCSRDLYDLAAVIEDKARYGLAKIESELDTLFKSPQGHQARMALAELTKLAAAGKQDSRLEEWCYRAGKCAPAEPGDFEAFHAAISNPACAQEAMLGWSVVVSESDPEAAVAMVLEILKADLPSLDKGDHLKRLFMRDTRLPEDTDFAKLEAMFPPPSGETDVMKFQPQDWARSELFRVWGERDPEAAADYVMAHRDRCEFSLFQRIRSESTNSSVEEELAWANRFPPGPYFDAAGFTVADRLLWSHPDEALKLGARINNPEIRKVFAERAEFARKVQYQRPVERDSETHGGEAHDGE
ncbi:sigma-70 family RNA polymerase sigma factor [Haloferula sp. BvORR071]|uniref:RNA polymerase sigma factor n=1 Tax=Haloferula sp. BvORR071 TaxID=1396141 RepID=UPI000697055A|nr:sigma-70 family RNA polymerase sigma factor [Haloferula sp. BvORR071]